MDISCIGEMVIDFFPGGDGIYIRKAGGAPANVAVAAARQGAKTSFCGCIGNDDFGRFLKKTLRDNKVEDRCPALTDKAITTMTFVTLGAEGERSFTFVRNPGADMLLNCADIDHTDACNAIVVHAGSCSLSKAPASEATIYAMHRAKEAGRIVSFDVNYRDLLWSGNSTGAATAVQDILPTVDLLKISDEELDLLGCEPRQAIEKYGIKVLVLTRGADGAECWFDCNRLTINAVDSECVDATGAGDAFWGVFLASMLKDGLRTVADIKLHMLEKAMRYGNISGALCVRHKGAMESLPFADETEKLFSEVYA